MSTEYRLKEYILSKYKSVRAFSIEANIPYSTLDNIFKRSIKGASLYNITQICNALNIDINKLIKDEIVSTHEKIISNTKNENFLIESYRELNKEGQEYIDKQVVFASQQEEYKKHNQSELGDQKNA